MKMLHHQSLALLSVGLLLPACGTHRTATEKQVPNVTVETVHRKDVSLSQQYVCQILSHHRIDVRTPASGSVGEIAITEGQTVQQDDLLFQVKAATGNADGVVTIKAPFEGVIGKLNHLSGANVLKGESLTTLADNSQINASFAVSEAQYLDFFRFKEANAELKIELLLAGGTRFGQLGQLTETPANFGGSDGNVKLQARFPNPTHLLRNGQPATLVISHLQKGAIVVPQRATFEVNQNRYVYVIDQDRVAHRREIILQAELDDGFVVKTGLDAGEKIVVDGIRQIRDGDQVTFKEHQPTEVAANQQ